MKYRPSKRIITKTILNMGNRIMIIHLYFLTNPSRAPDEYINNYKYNITDFVCDPNGT